MTSIRTSSSPRRPQRARIVTRARGRGVLERVREQADQHLAQQHPVALRGEVAARRRASTSIPSGAATASADSSITSATSSASAPPSPTASIRASVSSDSVSRLIRSASSESRLRKCSRASGSSLAPARRTSIAPEMPGDRVAQLVRGVGDELALGDLAAQLLGAVADHGEHRALGRQLAGVERVDAVADPQRVVLGHRPARGAAQPGDQRRDRAAVGADQRRAPRRWRSAPRRRAGRP